MSPFTPTRRPDWLGDVPLLLGQAAKFTDEQKGTCEVDLDVHTYGCALPEDCAAVLAWEERALRGAVHVLYLKRPPKLQVPAPQRGLNTIVEDW